MKQTWSFQEGHNVYLLIYLFVCLVHVVYKFALWRASACVWKPEAWGICLNHSPAFVCMCAHMCVHPCVHAKSLNTFSKALILSALGLQPHDSGSPLSPVTRTHPRDNTSELVWGEAKQLSEVKQKQGEAWASPTGWQPCATLWRNRKIKPVLWEPDRSPLGNNTDLLMPLSFISGDEFVSLPDT